MVASNTLRERMVDRQIRSRGITDERTLEAMRKVPREEFVSEGLEEFAYEDSPLPIEEGQTISQPLIVALMIEALEVKPGDRALEIGAGSGYAAAVLSRVAREVFAVERFESLAAMANARMKRLGYNNVRILRGDGTLGWPEYAPYDVIMVSAGGPEVPESLLKQLAVGGRLVIPVGTDQRSQKLLRIRRTSEHQYQQDSLGSVQFVPLIGTEGWSLDGLPLAPHRARRPLRITHPKAANLTGLIAQNAEPFSEIAQAPLDPLIDRIGDARVVLIGEATHGTSEFYRMRARVTQELIQRKGFTVVAIEGDWPDTRTIDRYVRGQPRASVPPIREPAFSRFPTWMWRNHEMRDFVHWLAEHNKGLAPDKQVSIHGLDLYSLNNSIGAVLDYLDRVDPVAAESARIRYGCFSPWEMDPATYGRAAVSGRLRSCEDDVVQVMIDLFKQRMKYLAEDDEAFFDAERNATVIREAERYYRTMYYGSRDSWNLRDRHMFETLEAVLAYRGQGGSARAVVWAHNSHIGNAAATEMSVRGEFNIGQLAKERFGVGDGGAYAVGFGTDHGTVAAASNWDEPMQVMTVRPSHQDSYERLCHDTNMAAFLLPLGRTADPELRSELLNPHLERAIGVVYRPDTEIVSHYFQAALPAQFDEYIWFDQTIAVRPVQTHETAGLPETYPFGL
ncbi:MAG: protein-L-isoaspartate(D-aspartate) O-methyltransferase [Phycisphaerales bacterium]